MRNFRFPAIASITGTTTRISSHRHVEQKASGSLDSSCWYPRRIIRSAGPPKNTKKMEGGMDRLDLPKHIVERVERRWAQKLQEQALAWKSSRSEAQSTTATGVPVIRRGKRARKSQ